ncbi:MAG: hypothetical protein A3F68_03320 [Acidobacteria bacterium RIFCSPLOWO2_12_FULL_54_10]|nr:MAG: hypothetical protein A3F68_03320 [Acidobacteria bacterium RIFCSPLOWO2_12_FULL_54_10]
MVPVLLGACGIAAVASYYLLTPGIDFQVYHAAGNATLQGGSQLYGPQSGLGWPMQYRYPPLFLLLFAPFAVLPLAVAFVIWNFIKLVVLGMLLITFTRQSSLKGLSPNWMVASVLAIPYLFLEFKYGNAQFFVFALVCLTLLSLPEHPVRAGGALGLAIGLKVWPLFFVPYLFAGKHWKAASYAAIGAVLITLAPMIYWGWSGNLDLLQQWYGYEHQIAGTPAHMWFPSQSLRGLLTRYLTDIPYETLPDPNYMKINLASLDGGLVYFLWILLAGCGYLALLKTAWKQEQGASKLEMHGLAMCALALLQPHSQKQTALVVLILPAIVASARLKDTMPQWGKMCVYGAITASVVQLVFASSRAQRLFQVLGVDTLIMSLLAIGLIASLSKPSRRQYPEFTGID